MGTAVRRRPRGAARLALALAILAASVAAVPGGDRAAVAVFAEAETQGATLGSAPAFGVTTWWLHHAPTPPTGDTTRPGVLAMNAQPPTATALHNYDTDHDAAPGRTLQRGGSGVGETLPARHVAWRGPAAPLTGQTILGPVSIDLWTAMRDNTWGVRGELIVALRDHDPLTGLTLELGSTTVSAADWQSGRSGWFKTTAVVTVNAILLAGHQLELKVVAPSGSADDLWIAYDTVIYPSRVRLP